MELAKNQEHTVTIEGYGEGGMGVARIDGRVVFVHGALRGEKCRVLILKTLKSVAFAKVLEVLEPSSERMESDCPYFPRCGGCTYRHIRYEEELRLKRQRVQDNLSRIGGSDVTVEEILGAQDTLRYRNKAQYPVSKDGAVGFYRARTHEVIECEHCLLVRPEADAAAEALREYMQSCRVAGYDEKTGRGLIRHLYVRSNAAGESLICVLVNGDKLPKEDRLVALLRDACTKCTGIVLGTNTKKGNVILGDRYRTLWGSDRLEDTLCGKTFRLSVPSFYQVNRVQAERLYAKAIEFAGLTGQETVLDLYCGAGTITLALSDHAKKVLGAEIVPEAIDDARENAARNGLTANARFETGDLREHRRLYEHQSFDAVVVNPPYEDPGFGRRAEAETNRLARQGEMCPLADVCEASRFLLKNGGRLYMVMRALRLAETLALLRARSLEPRELLMVHPAPGKNASVFLVEARRSGGTAVTVPPPLFIYNAAGEYTPELRRFYAPAPPLP